MLSMILALTLLTVTPTQHIQLQTVTAPTNEQTEEVANICVGIMTKAVSIQEVVDKLHLDSKSKQQELVNTCFIYLQGVEDGFQIQQNTPPQNQLKKSPEASKTE